MVLLVVGWFPISIGIITVISILLLMVLLLVLRRVACHRYIELGEDSLLLPTGFLQLRTVQIPYNTLSHVWESQWALGTVLYLLVKQRKFEICCGICLKNEDYVTVRDFLIQRASDNRNETREIKGLNPE